VAAPAGFGVEDRLGRMDDPVRAVEDGEVVDLVHQAAAALGERDAEVLQLQLRDGLTPAEVGEVLGMNRNAANQLCHRIRQRFATAVRARVLWRGSRPACDELDELLRSAGLEAFDAEAVKVADRHAASCEQCSERRELKLQPAALFASVPIVAAPVLFKQQAAGALEAAGVPMDGSSFSSASSASSAGPSSGDDLEPHDSDVGDPDPEESAEGPDAIARRSGRARRIALMAGAAAAIFVLALLALASRVDEGAVDEELAVVDSDAADATTTTTTASTTAPPTSIAVEAPPETPTELVTPPTETGASTTTTATTVDPGPPPEPDQPPPTIRFSLRPAQAGTTYNFTGSTVPTLTWAVEGAKSVRVEGFADGQAALLSSSVSGSTRLCPGTVMGQSFSACVSQPGVYTYEILVEGQDGQSYRQAATLTIA
jgi:hypothetical protein